MTMSAEASTPHADAGLSLDHIVRWGHPSNRRCGMTASASAGVTLVTADVRLATAATRHCGVLLVG